MNKALVGNILGTRSMPIAPIVSNFLILYLYWIAFEWVFVSRIPSYEAIKLIRNTIDILPLGMLILSMIILNIKLNQLEVKIFSVYGALIVISVVSLSIEGASASYLPEFFGATFRFVPLLVIVRFTEDDFREKLFPHVRIIYWILVVLAVFNFVNKEVFIQAFLPAPEIFEVLPTTYKDPGISASFINTVEFSFFLLGLTVIYLNGPIRTSTKYIVSILSITLIILSFSIASILSLLIIFFLRSNRKWLVGGIMLGGLLLQES